MSCSSLVASFPRLSPASRSYEGMGTANVTCVSGCSCNSTLLDGTWERRASLFTITRFEVQLPEMQAAGLGGPALVHEQQAGCLISPGVDR